MINNIDAKTLRAWQQDGRDFILIDTLPSFIFKDGHLPGAVNLVSDDIMEQAPKCFPNLHATIVVYCASVDCRRAGLSAERLERLGYTQVFHFIGGKRDWVAAGLPLE
jgi:rhodanese-related sulfurtransferase